MKFFLFIKIKIKMIYYQIRYNIESKDCFSKPYKILDPNDKTFSYDNQCEKEVIETIKLFKKKSKPIKLNIWYTQIIEKDIYLDNWENNTIFLY